MNHLVREFGYLAVFIGTFLEGETILVVAGFAAYEAYLELPLVIVTAFFGSLFGDQLYFFIGRYQGPVAAEKIPELGAPRQPVQEADGPA